MADQKNGDPKLHPQAAWILWINFIESNKKAGDHSQIRLLRVFTICLEVKLNESANKIKDDDILLAKRNKNFTVLFFSCEAVCAGGDCLLSVFKNGFFWI